MTKAKKLPSGNWRCQVYSYTDTDNKRHYKSITAPTKKEAEYLASKWALNKKDKEVSTDTVRGCLWGYLGAKKGILSESTLLNYKKYIPRYPQWLMDTKLNALTDEDIDKFIREQIVKYSPKTVKNRYSLLSAALKYAKYDIGEHKLPAIAPKEYYVPTDAEVKRLLQYTKENDQELYFACLLAAYGCMRRGEVCGLCAEDIKGTTVHIRTSRVRGEDGLYIDKSTKTASSDRYVDLPQSVIDLLPKEGRIIDATPHWLTVRFSRVHDRLGFNENFTFHSLRHYAASMMHAIGVPDQYIQKRGGWSTPHTLQQIYRNTMDDYEKKFSDLTNAHLSNLI